VSVEVNGLVVRYGDVVAVDGVSFEARAGEVTVVLGPNGAGKTSTIEVCEGFRSGASGGVRVLGLDPIADHHQLTGRMGVMLQDGGVYPSARVADTVRHHCALHGRGVDADALVERLGLATRARATWRTLSGGERQRLALALALAAAPEVAFLDEPTSGVDVEGRDTIRAVVADLAAHGCTVVVASHEMSEAERIADKVVMFRQGRVVADGPIASLVRTRNRLTFRSATGLDVASLGAELGAVVADYGAGTYEVAHAPTADLVAKVTAWLAAAGLPLHGIDMGAESLEDAYRRLTGGDA
jgi:ABC-2 type transport system ATP-binding protein